jgi:hypothetical protein
MIELDAARLRSLLDYDPATGVFRWRPGRRGVRNGGVAGSSNGRKIQIRIDDRAHLAHRLAWLYVHGEWPVELDHANGDGFDNRLANLRPATRQENQRNRRAKGCYYRPDRDRWVAMIYDGRRSVFLGYHDTEQEARATYEAAARAVFGEFARA